MALKTAEAFKLLLREKSFCNILAGKLCLTKESKGAVACELKVEEEHQNLTGTLHGGLSATLVDVVSTLALHSSGLATNYGVSVDMNVTYLGAARVGQTVVVESETLKVGRRMAFLTVNIKDKESGKLLVQGRHTKYLG